MRQHPAISSRTPAPDAGSTEAPEPIADAVRPFVALIVDDSASQRKMLSMLLRKWHFEVIEAEDGIEACEVVDTRKIDFIISDWMMPRMSGIELCKAIRARERERYIYFILLTSKRAKDEVAEGLDAGADDFLSKPMNMGELQARLRAGARLQTMQADLVDKNQRITEAFDELNTLYQEIDRDLRAAAKLQESLIPPRQAICGGISVGIAYRPSGHVGGDLLGYFEVAPGRIAFYAIDVSGHGVSSALLTARLSNLFNPEKLDENVAVGRTPDGGYMPRDPAAIATDLNERIQDEADTDQYFTMLFADINLETGIVRFCQAGHPSPAIIRATGDIEFVGDGGAPIGLIPEMSYATDVVHLAAGDRLMIFSDGVTEAENPDGEPLEDEGLADLLRVHWGMSEREVLDNILLDLVRFTGTEHLGDDVSALLLTIPGNERR